MSFQTEKESQNSNRTGPIMIRKVKRRGETITAIKKDEQVDLLDCMQPLKTLVEEMHADSKDLIAIKEYCQNNEQGASHITMDTYEKAYLK